MFKKNNVCVVYMSKIISNIYMFYLFYSLYIPVTQVPSFFVFCFVLFFFVLFFLGVFFLAFYSASCKTEQNIFKNLDLEYKLGFALEMFLFRPMEGRPFQLCNFIGQ